MPSRASMLSAYLGARDLHLSKVFIHASFTAVVMYNIGRMVRTKLLRIIGKCIYCGSYGPQLSHEHIVPLGLGGEWILREASCSECQRITSRIELDVLRHSYKLIRSKMGLPSRRRNQKLPTYPLDIEKGGKEETVYLPIDQYPVVLPLPRFPPPAHIDNREYKQSITLNGIYHVQVGTPSLQQVKSSLGADSITYKFSFHGFKNGFSFARLLAKMAYGFAVDQYGVDIIDQAYILPSIMGQVNDVGKWVGCIGDSQPIFNRNHYFMGSIQNGDIYVIIKLFACFPGNSPDYLVIVAPAPIQKG